MPLLDRSEIEQEFGHTALQLKRIFGASHIRQAGDFDTDDEGRAPYGLMFLGESPEEMIALLKRVEEFTYGRPLKPGEREMRDDQARPMSGRNPALGIIGESVDAWQQDATGINLPPTFFHQQEYQQKLREFAALQESARSFQTDDSPRLHVPPDVSVVALSHASNSPWTANAVSFEAQGQMFRQLRLETEHPVASPRAAKQALEQRLRLPEGKVFIGKDNRINIPASNITAAQVEDLREPRVDRAFAAALYPNKPELLAGY